jgi:hypothetical protein
MITKTFTSVSYSMPELATHHERDTIEWAVINFSFLMGYNETLTYAQFADRMVGYSKHFNTEYAASILKSF